jgi:hypothetical protein
MQVADIVKEDDSHRVLRIGRFTEQRAHHGIRPAWFVHNGGPDVIEITPKNLQPFPHGTMAQARAARDHHASRLTGRMGIDHVYTLAHQYNIASDRLTH